jgi:hypothetical protein
MAAGAAVAVVFLLALIVLLRCVRRRKAASKREATFSKGDVVKGAKSTTRSPPSSAEASLPNPPPPDQSKPVDSAQPPKAVVLTSKPAQSPKHLVLPAGGLPLPSPRYSSGRRARVNTVEQPTSSGPPSNPAETMVGIEPDFDATEPEFDFAPKSTPARQKPPSSRRSTGGLMAKPAARAPTLTLTPEHEQLEPALTSPLAEEQHDSPGEMGTTTRKPLGDHTEGKLSPHLGGDTTTPVNKPRSFMSRISPPFGVRADKENGSTPPWRRTGQPRSPEELPLVLEEPKEAEEAKGATYHFNNY